MQGSIRLLIVEDDLDFRYLIQSTVKAQADMEITSLCATKEEGIYLARREKPDLVLMDLNLSSTELDGIGASREIRASTNAKVVILTAYDDPITVINASTQAFASAYVFKSQFESLIPILRETASGHTPQEYLIQTAILSRLSSAEQGVLFFLLGRMEAPHSSSKTVSNQKTEILKKLGLHSQKELLHIFAEFRERASTNGGT